LGAFIDALRTLDIDSYDEDLVESNLEEGAPFCFYCGFTVHKGTSVCPRCGQRLDDDADEDEHVV
jgi:predicted amidophosphoribosyltransferase